MSFSISRSKSTVVITLFLLQIALKSMRLIYLFIFCYSNAITLEACNKLLKKQSKTISSSNALESDLKRCDDLRVRDEKVRVRNALNFFKRISRPLKLLQEKIKVGISPRLHSKFGRLAKKLNAVIIRFC